MAGKKEGNSRDSPREKPLMSSVRGIHDDLVRLMVQEDHVRRKDWQ
jgi:hypothetical protein